MLKSVFAKYVMTFMALLTVSFLLLLFIVNTVISNEAHETQRNSMTVVAETCAESLADFYEGNENAQALGLRGLLFSEQSPDGAHALRLLSAVLAGFEDMTVYVTDGNGDFIFCTGKIPEQLPEDGAPLFSPDAEADTATAATSAEGETVADHGGLFFESPNLLPPSKEGYVYRIPITVEEDLPVGYVVVASAEEAWSATLHDALQSMIVASLWVMVAALIAIYFITERIVSPLRVMSKAAKRMAVGRFDTRVPVRGRDEVAELAMAFNQMAGDLENLERMRNSFVANVSHDLRTPMTTISGFIDGILDGGPPPKLPAGNAAADRGG